MDRETQLQSISPLTAKERQSIKLAVDLSRWQIDFRRVTVTLSNQQFSSPALQARHRQILEWVGDELSEEKKAGHQDVPVDQVDLYLQQADATEAFCDYALAALGFARVAKAQEAINDVRLHSTLDRARQCIENIESDWDPGFSSLLSQAIILGVEKRSVTSQDWPSTARIAAAITKNPGDTGFINNCISVFPEKDLETLRVLLPEKLQRILDRALIRLLTEAYSNQSQLERYLADERNLFFFKSLVKKYSQGEVLVVLDELSSAADVSIARDGPRILGNLEKMSNLLGRGDFAAICRKELLPKAILEEPRDFDEQLTQVVKNRIKETVRAKNTDGLVEMLDADPSDFILSHIGMERLMTSLIGEMIDGNFRKSKIEVFVRWIIQTAARPDEFERIIHALGGPAGSEGNNQAQAFLFSLFILPAQEKLQTATGVKFQRSELYQAGKTMIDALSKQDTDVGVRFKHEKDYLETTIKRECSRENDKSGFSTEIEVFYLDEHEREGHAFEFITPIRQNVDQAFSIASAFVRLNQALKEEGLLWPIAGHSLHTHVSEFRQSPDSGYMRHLFAALSIICLSPVNPVDRQEYMLRAGRDRLVTYDPIGDDMYKVQNRQGMILDRLSFDIVKDLALCAKRIFVDVPSGRSGAIDLEKTIWSVCNAVKEYIDDEMTTDKKLPDKEGNQLDKVRKLYSQFADERDLNDENLGEIVDLLGRQLDRVLSLEADLKQRLISLKDAAAVVRTKHQLAFLNKRKEETARELREVSQGKIKSDYFFLLGKRRRDECARLIHVTLTAALFRLTRPKFKLMFTN